MTTISYQSLLAEHSRVLKIFALRFTKDQEDADDLLQDTMVKAIRYQERFEPGTNIKAWLITIMRNTFINRYRQNVKRRDVISENEITSKDMAYHKTENDAVGTFVLEDIKHALQQLPSDYYYPFIKHFEGFKYHEIAEAMNIPIGTVKTKIHIARKILKKQLRKYENAGF